MEWCVSCASRCDCLLCNKRRGDAKQAAGQSALCSLRYPAVHAWLQPNSGSVMWTNHIIVTKEPKFIRPEAKETLVFACDSFDFAGAEKERKVISYEPLPDARAHSLCSLLV